MTRSLAVHGALVALLLTLTAGSAIAQPSVSVYFLRGEQLARASHPGSTPADAVRQVLAGPTRAEVKIGFRGYVPAGTRLLHLKLDDGLATVDLSSAFVSGANAGNRLARLSQLVRTLTGLDGTTRVQLLVEGKTVEGVFPGVPTETPITYRFLATPDVPVPQPPPERLGPPNAQVKAAQTTTDRARLPRCRATTTAGPARRRRRRLSRSRSGRDSTVRAPSTQRRSRASLTALRPTPLTHAGPGRRAEILLDRQVALLIDNDSVVRTIAVSTGKPSTPTPPGRLPRLREDPALVVQFPSASGCRWRCRSTAESRSTSSPTFRRTPPPTDAFVRWRRSPGSPTASRASGCP